MASRRFDSVILAYSLHVLADKKIKDDCMLLSTDSHECFKKHLMCLQVLEILNDKEVWQRQENGPPKYLGSVKETSRSWWQRRTAGQQQQA